MHLNGLLAAVALVAGVIASGRPSDVEELLRGSNVDQSVFHELAGSLEVGQRASSPRQTPEEAIRDARDLVERRAEGSSVLCGITRNETMFEERHLVGRATGMMEYFAAGSNGSLYFLLLPIAPNVRNVWYGGGPKHLATVTVKDELSHRTKGPWNDTSRARLTLFGQLERLEEGSEQESIAKKAYGLVHPDSKRYWPPSVHAGFWARFDASALYYVGGFGSTSQIGWLDPDEYRTSQR